MVTSLETESTSQVRKSKWCSIHALVFCERLPSQKVIASVDLLSIFHVESGASIIEERNCMRIIPSFGLLKSIFRVLGFFLRLYVGASHGHSSPYLGY